MPSLSGAGMPAAYDLSSVIAGGSNVGHNNLIPLGEYGAGGGQTPPPVGGHSSPPTLPCSPPPPPSTANTGIVNHTHSRMGSIMSTGIVQGNPAPHPAPSLGALQTPPSPP